MNPEMFGRGTWFFIFYIIYRYEEKDIEFLKKLLHITILSLSCEKCKNHSLEYLNKENFFNINNNYDFFKIFVTLRNEFYKTKIDLSCFDKENYIKKKNKFFILLLSN